MYRRNAQGWSKHFDFMVVDELSLQIAFILAVLFRHHAWAYDSDLYRNFGVMLILVDAFVIALHNSMHNVISRGYQVEFAETVKHCVYVFAVSALFVFAAHTGGLYSRIILTTTFVLHIIFGYIMRVLWKLYIKKRGGGHGEKSRLLAVLDPAIAEKTLERLGSDKMAGYRIAGVVLTENPGAKKYVDFVCGYPIVADIDTAADYIVREWVDSVYIDAPLSDEKVIELMDNCAKMGVPTHYHVPNMSRNGVKRFSEKIGGTTVLTTSINYATPLQALVKRLFDIATGLVGSFIALIIIAIVGPIIKKQSPGPILFTQERIGQNGKHFKMYKIRSMYLDAEERKKDLMDQNRVKDGLMFKLDFDPRIIGNEILPDGTKKTGIGEFIRRTSLDEFPQFFCVLQGVMSTIGTRPPTLEEYSLYKYHHRARMAIKPGITGMWQVSGRSEITDFEEVVKLDTEYITNWSIGLDIKILFKTIAVLFTGRGAM